MQPLLNRIHALRASSLARNAGWMMVGQSLNLILQSVYFILLVRLLGVEEYGIFAGAATIAQVKLFNNHPIGRVLKEERLRALAGDGGIQECGFAQNCVEVCPKSIPLTNTISDISRDVLIQKAKDFLRN